MNAQERFLQTPHAAEFRKMAESIAFEEAADAALIKLGEEIPFIADPQVAMGDAYRQEGARKFLRILRTIADRPKPAERPIVGQLNHGA